LNTVEHPIECKTESLFFEFVLTIETFQTQMIVTGAFLEPLLVRGIHARRISRSLSLLCSRFCPSHSGSNFPLPSYLRRCAFMLAEDIKIFFRPAQRD
jgi:hypothetical protein